MMTGKGRLVYVILCGLVVHIVFKMYNLAATESGMPIVDSAMRYDEAMGEYHNDKRLDDSMALVDVYYYSFDGKLHKGQLLIASPLVEDIRGIFQDILAAGFPIAKVIPIVKYNWNDDRSVRDNNTSGFNYRVVEGTRRLSDHARGRAVDVNPYLNPWVKKSGRIYSGSRPYNPEILGTIQKGDAVWTAFIKRGWKWGGSWAGSKDYQHFYKK
ncbi:MAG: M15 family metallopeptidase [Candidatus Kapabacteria bacterium]|nr:M15 family metallopeptidase [Candidatus Kapabacteria bacterium]